MIYRGKVTATASSGVYVTVTELHPTQAFGPLKYAGAKPATNDIVLVMQVGSDDAAPDLVVLAPVQDPADKYVARSTSTDNAVVRFDGTTGAIQSSGVTIDDNGGFTTTGNATVQRSTDVALYVTAQAGDAYISMNAIGGNNWLEFRRSSSTRFAFLGLTDDLVLRRYDDSAAVIDQIMRWIRSNGRVRILTGGDAGLQYGDGGARIMSGAGSPLNNVTAPKGSLWLRTDGGAGTTLYVKESGTDATGWVAK